MPPRCRCPQRQAAPRDDVAGRVRQHERRDGDLGVERAEARPQAHQLAEPVERGAEQRPDVTVRRKQELPQDGEAADRVGNCPVAATLAAAGLEAPPAALVGQPQGDAEAGHDGEPGQGEGGVAVASVRRCVDPHGGAQGGRREHGVLEHAESDHARHRLLPARAGAAQRAIVELEAALHRAREVGAEARGHDADRLAEREARAAVHPCDALQRKCVGDVGGGLRREADRKPHRIHREQDVEHARMAREAGDLHADVVRGDRAEQDEEETPAGAPDQPGRSRQAAGAPGWRGSVGHPHGEGPAAHQPGDRVTAVAVERCAVRSGMVASAPCCSAFRQAT